MNDSDTQAYLEGERPGFVRFVRSLFGSDQAELDPEDVVQDVLLSLLERGDQPAPEYLAAYLYRSLRNRVIDRLRTRLGDFDTDLKRSDTRGQLVGLARRAEDLQDAIPLTDETLADALNLVNVFDDLISEMNALAMDNADPTAAQIETAIHNASTADIDLTASTVTDNDPDFDVSLVIDISRGSLLNLSPDESFPISGGTLNVTATATATINLHLDESAISTNLNESVWIVGTPEITFGANATGAVAFMAQLGFTDVDVTGTADLNLDTKRIPMHHRALEQIG